MKIMKTQRAVLPLAFLSAAFMLGCQEQASGPVGLDGMGVLLDPAGPHPHVDATFAAVLTGDVGGAGDLIGPQGGKNVLQTRPGGDPFMLTLPAASFQAKVTDGPACFGGGQPFNATMIVGQKTPGDAEHASIKLFFDAKDKNGIRDINYVLDLLDGEITGATWPADGGGTSTINGGKFTLAHANGPGNKDGCKAKDVGLAFVLSVE